MTERIRGLDVSHWQGEIDFAKAKANGAQFVIFKSSQNTWIDTKFIENYEKAGKAGLLRGAYHFSDYSNPAAPQAEFYYSLLKKYPVEIPAALDYEFYAPWGIPSNYNNAKWIMDFIDAWKGRPLTLYCNSSFIKNNLNKPVPQKILDMPLWVAWYPNTWAKLNDRQPIVDPWNKWVFWQHTDRADGKAYGTQSKQVDENYFNGSLENLKEWINFEETLPDPEPSDCPECEDVDWDAIKKQINAIQEETTRLYNMIKEVEW